MRPPKKKKKKKGKEASSTTSAIPQLSDPLLEQRRSKFPGLSLPDDPGRAMALMEPEREEAFNQGGPGSSQDLEVANAAISEVCMTVLTYIKLFWDLKKVFLHVSG